MWTWIANLLSGPIIASLVDIYKARLASINTQDQKALELLEAEVQAEIAARAEATKLLMLEQEHFLTRMIRPLFALPFIIFAFKVIVWDKVLGLGVTEALDPRMWGVFDTIIIAYFGATAVERVSRIFKR